MGDYKCIFYLFYIGIVGFFPDTAYYYGSALLVPGSIAVILLAIRGSFYAFENYGSKKNIVYLFCTELQVCLFQHRCQWR